MPRDETPIDIGCVLDISGSMVNYYNITTQRKKLNINGLLN